MRRSLLLFSLWLCVFILACSIQPSPRVAIPTLAISSGQRANIPILQATITAVTTIPRRPPPPPTTFLEEIQADRLMLAVHSLAQLQTRHVLSTKLGPTQGITAARDWLLTQFNEIRTKHPSHAIQVWTQPVQYTWNSQAINVHNVVAVFQGTSTGSGVIIIGAHYDTISTDWANGQARAPGANDNASGVAALLEIAHIMAGTPHRSTLIFVAFAAEETGRQGSLTFIRDFLQTQQIDVQAMLNLDILGSIQGQNGEFDQQHVRLFSSEPNDSASRQLARQIELISRYYVVDMRVQLQSAEERRGRWGDHQSFSAAGYPAVRFIQAVENSARQHTSLDIPDAIHTTYLMRNTQVVLATVQVLGSGLPAPSSIFLVEQGGNPRATRLQWTPSAGADGYLVAFRMRSSLAFDEFVIVDNLTDVPQDKWRQYDYLAIGSLDSQGHLGALSAEQRIQTLPVDRLAH